MANSARWATSSLRRAVKKTQWIAVLFVVAVIGAIVVTTFSGDKYRCEVCMVFNGRQNCGTVSAHTREDAWPTTCQSQ